jgi:outer membrane protein OmpA-like peptidoglycan-associated protein
MMQGRSTVTLVAVCAAALACSCGPQRVEAPEGPAPDTIVLLPDPDTGATGRATVSNASGSVDLDAPRASTRVAANQPPAPATVMTEADVDAAFGEALAALPPAPQHFTVYFQFESDELTDESRALVPEILEAVRNRPHADVVIVGHTDTTGSPADNVSLGLGRATRVRDLLAAAGLVTFVEVTSHGEGELLVPTPDGTREPRNRRVEITIR